MGISIKELIDLYVDTVQRIGMHLMLMEDEELEYNLFEEFDIGATSFLHENTLSKLAQAKFLSESAVQKSAELRDKYFELVGLQQWDAGMVRENEKWQELFKLSDMLVAEIEKQ